MLRGRPDEGTTDLVRETTDAAWVDLIPGTPAWLPDGRLLTTVDDPTEHPAAGRTTARR